MSDAHTTVNQSSINSLKTEVIEGYFNSHNFLTSNGYSAKTNGLVACILRNTLGDIEFSDALEKYEESIRKNQTISFVTLLDDKRKKLEQNEASVHKCLILNRLISYIQDNEEKFMALLSEIYEDTKRLMTDNQVYQMVTYPGDFRQREENFKKRQYAQNIERLFHHVSAASEAIGLIQLQNKTTLHLSYIIDTKMRYEPSFRKQGLDEIKKILNTSFIIITQPHCNNIPVTVYDGNRSKSGTAKISVTIICLLHDFIQTHPNMIKLNDIEPVLSSPSNTYKLVGSHRLSWEKRQLQLKPDTKPHTVLCAELKNITIKRSSSEKKVAKTHDKLHSFTFPIILDLDISEHKISEKCPISLESMPFAISIHVYYNAYYLAKIILDDIQRFSQIPPTSATVDTMFNFLHRYIIHRLGVEPKADLQTYLRAELTAVATNKKKKSKSLEDTYMDFLVLFVHRIEFMQKNLVLALFYEDGLFLAFCDCANVDETMNHLAKFKSPIVGLRLDTIRTDCTINTLKTQPESKKTKIKKASIISTKDDKCAVRILIHEGCTDNPVPHTFDSDRLGQDLFKFVTTANGENSSSINILSILNGVPNTMKCKTYDLFQKYYSDQLPKIFKIDSDYKAFVSLLIKLSFASDNNQVNGNRNNNSTESAQISTSTTTFEHQFTPNDMEVNYTNKTSLQDILLTIDPDDIVQYAVNNPVIHEKLLQYFGQLFISSATAQEQQQQTSSSPILDPSSYNSQPESQQLLSSISSMPNPSTYDSVSSQSSNYSNENELSLPRSIEDIENDLIESCKKAGYCNITEQTTNTNNQQ